MKIIIARHGKTNENMEEKLSGNSNNAQLIEEGYEHAKRLGEILGKRKIDGIFCSPLDRARETARPVLEVLGKEAVVDERLTEFDFGTLDSMKEEGEAKEGLIKRRKDLNFKFPEG